VPLAEAQIALGKQKNTRIYVLWNGGIRLITEILRKTASSHKILVKSGNRLLSYSQKRFLKWRLSAILNIKNVHICSSDCHRVSNLHLHTKCHQNRIIFRWDMAILRFAIWRPSAILNFRNFEFMARDLYGHAILYPCAKFYWNRTISCWVVAKNDFF